MYMYMYIYMYMYMYMYTTCTYGGLRRYNRGTTVTESLGATPTCIVYYVVLVTYLSILPNQIPQN